MDTILTTEDAIRQQAEFDQRCNAWAKENGLRPSTRRTCPHHLLGKRCPIGCNYASSLGSAAGWDHSSIWLKDGKPFVIVLHPYHFDEQRLHEWCERIGLHYVVRPKVESWYYPNQTWMIELYAK